LPFALVEESRPEIIGRLFLFVLSPRRISSMGKFDQSTCGLGAEHKKSGLVSQAASPEESLYRIPI
jgi:hypothetical protein